MNPTRPVVGVTVMPEYLQVESVAGVLDNLVSRAGVTAVSTSPYVMEPADEATGGREPPADAGAGSVRLLDRPLWDGKRELWVRTAPSFEPNRALYAGLRYQPAEPNALTTAAGHVVDDFIAAAHDRNLQVHFQIQSAIPPGYRVQFGGPAEDDQPRLPDGRIPSRRVDNNGSLASPHIRAYQDALIRDLIGRYPQIDGLRVDWPEYPPYLLDSALLDFSEHARTAANRLGYDFEAMRHAVAALSTKLQGGLTDDDCRALAASDGGRYAVLTYLTENPAILDWLRFKAALSEELLAGFRRTMNDAGGKQMQLLPTAFPPPWSLVSGMNFAGAARHSNAISVKLYSMHWLMMIRFYGDVLAAANPQVSDSALVRAVVSALDIADDGGLASLADYHYPGPEEAHEVGAGAQTRKIQAAQAAAGDTPIWVLAHGYGPVDDFRHRLHVARTAGAHGFWINRYGYLSDAKLDAIGEVARAT